MNVAGPAEGVAVFEVVEVSAVVDAFPHAAIDNITIAAAKRSAWRAWFRPLKNSLEVFMGCFPFFLMSFPLFSIPGSSCCFWVCPKLVVLS